MLSYAWRVRLWFLFGVLMGALLLVTYGQASPAPPVPGVIYVSKGKFVQFKGKHIQCVVTDALFCHQTAGWPRLEWVMYRNELHVLRTPQFGGQTETLFVGKRKD